MSKGTTARNLRVADPLWTDALAKAEAENTDVSTVLRALLAAWVAGGIPTPTKAD